MEYVDLDHIKLLLVDDEEGYTKVLSNRMTKRKINVTAANSGSEAIQALRKQDFDVAVLDLKMEDMDGIEVLKIFKKMDPQLVVIMLTGHGSEKAARVLGWKPNLFDIRTIIETAWNWHSGKALEWEQQEAQK